MRQLVVASEARRDMLAILRDSQRKFGPHARARYRRLIEQAFAELVDRPERPAARCAPELGDGLTLYHLRHVAARDRPPERVASPRHFLVYRYDDNRIEIVRVLHDYMDVAARLGGAGAG